MELLDACIADPFKGIGKPEPLKQNLKGLWSRRITAEHRLVYRVTDERIMVTAMPLPLRIAHRIASNSAHARSNRARFSAV